MEVELSGELIKLPRLADSADVTLPESLTNAHAALAKLSNDAAGRAVQIAGDDRWSPVERQRQLDALANETCAEIAKLGEVTTAVAMLADESEADLLRKAAAQFDSSRLLAIAQSIAARSREAKLSTLLRARNDPETAAAFIFAPQELTVADGLDARLLNSLRDSLIDSVNPSARGEIATTRFALARLGHGIEAAAASLRKLCNSELPPAQRIQRVA